MKTLLDSTQQHFESACNRTPEYLRWHLLFRKAFGKFLKANGATDIAINRPNHFDASGFFRASLGQVWWFRIEDLRWSKDRMLIRTAQDFKDYIGGRNQYIDLNKTENIFELQFDKIVNGANIPS